MVSALQIAQFLEQHPKVIERPIVVDEDSNRAVLGRPPDGRQGSLDVQPLHPESSLQAPGEQG